MAGESYFWKAKNYYVLFQDYVLINVCSSWYCPSVSFQDSDTKGDTGVSLREIGRTVAAEVEKHFETKVNPETIKTKALRMQKQSGSNEPPKENNEETAISEGFEKTLKKSAKTENRGGKREGSGRMPTEP